MHEFLRYCTLGLAPKDEGLYLTEGKLSVVPTASGCDVSRHDAVQS